MGFLQKYYKTLTKKKFLKNGQIFCGQEVRLFKMPVLISLM